MREKVNHMRKHFEHFSKIIVASVMLMFFVGIGYGIIASVFLGLNPQSVLDFIEVLTTIAFIGYFGKAFGENTLKIVMPYIPQIRIPKKEDFTNE